MVPCLDVRDDQVVKEHYSFATVNALAISCRWPPTPKKDPGWCSYDITAFPGGGRVAVLARSDRFRFCVAGGIARIFCGRCRESLFFGLVQNLHYSPALADHCINLALLTDHFGVANVL